MNIIEWMTAFHYESGMIKYARLFKRNNVSLYIGMISIYNTSTKKVSYRAEEGCYLIINGRPYSFYLIDGRLLKGHVWINNYPNVISVDISEELEKRLLPYWGML